ncbi:PcfB family protein [Acetatifactor muris]|uniref:PcfB family protein n=1 Tax=Acetatifactor muris TaxID=879566 RepID=UPI0023F56CDF|nr:DUF3801 domain-containing protein [Acetatifactor muris]
MAEEIQEAIQIIRVGYDGLEIAMKISGGAIKEAKKALDFLIAVLEKEKTMGKIDMRNLLMKGGDLQVFQFNMEDLSKVEKMAKQYGILYSVLPDINKADGKSEIIFHTEAVPRVNMMVQKLKFGRIATFDDYLKNGDEKEMNKILSFLKEQKKGNERLHTAESAKANEMMDGLIEKVGLYAMEKSNISVEDVKEKFGVDKEEAENILGRLEKIGVLEKGEDGMHKVVMDRDAFLNRFRGYRELVGRMQAAAVAQDKNFLDITITKKLIVEENDHAVKTRVPGTWGEEARYLWIGKEKIMEIHSGKTLLTFLIPDKEYKLYSADNKVVVTMRGNDLYDGYYDKVETEVRKRYEQAERKTKAAQQKKATTVKESSIPKGR